MGLRLMSFGFLAVAVCLSFLLQSLSAADLRQAQVTQVIHEVTLLGANAEPRLAAVNDKVGDGTTVRTGADSRAELTFIDKSLTRLGANTDLSFGKDSGGFEMRDGVVFLQAPKSIGGTRIKTNGVCVEVSGATAVFESRAPTYKLLVLQGTARLYRPRHVGDSVLVRAGQMTFGSATTPVSDPVDFDVGRFVKTCRLITEFAPLRNGTLMANESQKQQRAKSKKILIDTNLVINGEGTLVSIVDPTPADALPPSIATASPAPTPFRMTLSIDKPANIAR